MKLIEILLEADHDKTDYSTFVHTAFENYNINVIKAELIRHNENITFDILADKGHFVLRIRKPREGFSLGVLDSGVSPFELLVSETNLLRFISKHSTLSLQEPIKTKSDNYVCDVCGYPACLLRYIEGTPLNKNNVENFAEQLGLLASELHRAAEGFDCQRYVYSHQLLSKIKAEMITARDADHIKSNDCSVCIRSLDAIDSVMERLDSATGIQLIHCDMGMSNILLTEQGLTAIDFSLCGYGYRAMECGMLASNFSSDEAIESMRLSYCQASGVPVNRYDTDAFLAMSVMLFIACQHERFYKNDWFVGNMRRWTAGCLEPLNWINDL